MWQSAIIRIKGKQEWRQTFIRAHKALLKNKYVVILIIKFSWLWDCLIFMIGIPKMVRPLLYTKTPPGIWYNSQYFIAADLCMWSD